MSKRKIITITLIAVTAVSLGATAFAFSRHYGNPVNHANYIVEEIKDELELNETQVEKLALLKEELLTVHGKMHHEKSEKLAMIIGLIDSPNFNQTQAMEIINNTTQTLSDNAPTLVALLGDFYDSLTEEQQAELRDEITERAESHHHGWKH